MYFNLYTWGMSQNRGAYMGAPNLFLFAKKEILGHPSFETFPHEKKHVELLCMYVSFCSPQVPAIYHVGFHVEF